MADPIPTSNLLALQYLQNLSGHISANPSGYGQSGPDAENLASLVADFAAKQAIVGDPAAKTKASVLARNQSKALAVQVARLMIQQIKYNQGVSDEAKVAAGVPLPRSGGYQPVPPPTTAPALVLVGSSVGSHTLEYRDSMDPTPRRKPPGVHSLYLYVAVADAPVADPTDARFYRAFGRSRFGVAFDHADNGKTATYFARWANANRDEGPLSAPISMTIAA